VAKTRALTLCGAGGIGKTRLALRILARVADEFPDGVWFAELGDLRQPELVVSRVAAAIGIARSRAGRCWTPSPTPWPSAGCCWYSTTVST
jgi:non-specific serine/threonine protein kinase